MLAVAGEPRTLVPSVGSDTPGPADQLFEVLHQSLVSYSPAGQPIPRIARSLPSLADGTWRLFPDGSMETVYQLRDDVRWQDGLPLTADDVVLGWRMFNSNALPIVSRRVARLIDSVTSPDPHTAVMHWRAPYTFANQLSGFDLTILPTHLLEAPFDLLPQQMAGHQYWQAAFVGLGPYRLVHWYAGISLELDPVADYFLGAPRAAHISVHFMPDDGSAMAAVLTGSVDVVLPRRAALGIMQSARQWGNGGGSLIVAPTYSWVFVAPQFMNPQPPALIDPRVRQALAYAIDRGAIAEAVAGDAALAAELWIPPSDRRYQLIASGVPRYQYSVDRAAGALREAGWRRDGNDGVLVNRGERLEMELSSTAEWYSTAALVGDYWRQQGVMVKENVISLGTVFDRAGRSTYPGAELAGAMAGLPFLDSRLRTSNAPGSDNGFAGVNRGHYASPVMDSLLDRVWGALDPTARDGAENRIARQVAEDLPIIGLYFYPTMTLIRGEVRNVVPPDALPPVARPMLTWNVHEWQK